MSKLISKIVVPDSSEATGYALYNVKDANAIRSSEKGVANGVATLDSSGKVPSSQLPSYVDDVIEGYYHDNKFYATYTPGQEEQEGTYSDEITPEQGKIYVDIPTNQSYRWSGSTYIVISSPYVLPTASANTLGGVKVGDGLAIDNNGVLSAEGGGSIEVVQTIGTSTTAVMSQNAVTNHIENTDVHVTAAEKEYWNSKVDPPSYSAPTAKTLTYTGSAQDLLNAGSSTIGSIQYSTNEVNWSTTIPQATNAGTYTVYWKFVGSEIVYIDSTAINVTIAKANPTYTAPTAKTLVYNGNEQELLNVGTTNDGTINYSDDNENWGSSIPQGTNAGSHTVYWKLTGDANHDDVASTAISVSIAKVTPTVTAPTAKTGLVYDGTAQELVNAGSTDFGTLQYSLDDETYGTSVPSVTNAGDYTVYYKVVGDNNINDVAAQSVSCNIGKADRCVTISDNQTNMTPSQSNTITITATGNPASSLISVTSSNTAVATISGTTVNAVDVGTTTITATVASDTNYNSGSASYSLNVVWPNGIYAAYADGSMRTADNADTNAIGVVVITDNCKFIIDKTNNTKAAWDTQYLTNAVIAGCFATDDANTAKTNYTGVSNTNAIAAVATGGEAAKYCRSCSKTIAGKTVYGYLGACGEWQAVYDNKTTVDSIMSTIGGTAISSYYWTSTQSQSIAGGAWYLLWDDGSADVITKLVSSGSVRPLYEIS